MPPPLPRPVQRDIPRPSPSRPPMIPRPRPAPQTRAFEASMQQPYQRIEPRNEQYRDTTGYFGHAPSHSNETMSLTSPASSQNISAAFRQCSVPQSDTLPFGHAPDPRQERGHHDTVSLAQLSLHSAGLGDQRTHYSIENSRSIEHGFNAAPSALHADPQYQGPQGVAAQYNHEFPRGLPIRLFHSSYESPHIVSSQRQNFSATHAPHEVVGNQRNYADSPFFKHNGSVSRPDTMQRPPARGNNPQHQFRTFVDNYRIPTASTLDSQRLHGVQTRVGHTVLKPTNQRMCLHKGNSVLVFITSNIQPPRKLLAIHKDSFDVQIVLHHHQYSVRLQSQSRGIVVEGSLCLHQQAQHRSIWIKTQSFRRFVELEA